MFSPAVEVTRMPGIAQAFTVLPAMVMSRCAPAGAMAPLPPSASTQMGTPRHAVMVLPVKRTDKQKAESESCDHRVAGFLPVAHPHSHRQEEQDHSGRGQD